MLSFQHGPKFVESVKTPNTPQYLRIHTPPKTGRDTRRWRIINEETGETVDSYTPDPPPKRDKPICDPEKSWAKTIHRDIGELVARTPVHPTFSMMPAIGRHRN